MFPSLTQPKSTRFAPRRPLWMLACALLILAVAIGGRLVFNAIASAPAGPPVAVAPSAREQAARWRARLQQDPDDAHAHAQLGLSLLQQVRETADAALYTQAETAFAQALQRDPHQLDALIGRGVLALARHDFHTALEWADRAQAINPFRAEILGIRVDALVELGRYDEAVVALQKMVDLRPDLQSYSRIAYLRELHGDVDGAIEAMQAAVDSGMPGVEATRWAQVQLGHLHFNRGDLQRAEAAYRDALRHQPGYAHALAGLARVDAARGRHARAITAYEEIVTRLPLPEFVIPLGELYAANGRDEQAQAQYELVRVLQQLNADAGMNVELELVDFNVEHGANPARAVEQARDVYANRPTIYAADVLAWALYQQGNYAEASRYSAEALRLGTQDAHLYYHAGMIAHKNEDNETARQHLQKALEINPYFSIRDAERARAVLERIQT